MLYLHDERQLSNQQAGFVLAAMQALAIVVRIVLGRWSDVLGDRIQPLRLMGTASGIALAVTALLLGASTGIVIAAFVVAGTLGMSWNGLAFAGAAELAGRARSGAALGFSRPCSPRRRRSLPRLRGRGRRDVVARGVPRRVGRSDRRLGDARVLQERV